MKLQSINVLGYTGNNSQFTVKTLGADLKISKNSSILRQKIPVPTNTSLQVSRAA